MQYKKTDQIIGERLQELRMRNNYSLRYVGERVGKNNVTILNYETGRHGVDIPTLKKLCNLYGVNMLEFLAEIYEKI